MKLASFSITTTTQQMPSLYSLTQRTVETDVCPPLNVNVNDKLQQRQIDDLVEPEGGQV